MKKIIKSKKIAIGILIIVVLAVSFFFIFYKKSPAQTFYSIAYVEKGKVVETVSGTGQISGQNQVNITPLASGKIVSVNVKQGDIVKEGDIIAIIDAEAALASLNQAKASLETAKANYAKIMAGPTDLEIKSAELSIKQAEDNLKNSYINLLNNINSIYISVLNNIHNNIDDIFEKPNEINPTLPFVSSDSQAQIDAQNGKVLTNEYLKKWQAELQKVDFNSPQEQIETLANNSLNYLNTIKNFLSRTFDALIYASPSSKISSSTIESYKNTVSSVLSSVQQNISSLTSGLQTIQNNKTNIEQAKISLEKLKTPPTEAEIQSAKTAILNAETQVRNAQTNYDNYIIRAPFTGEVAILNIQKGSLITGSTVAGTTGSTVIGTIVAKQKIAQISLNEIDVAKVKVGDKAILTIDALPDTTIEGKVVEIEGVGSTNQGVVNYNVKILFDGDKTSVKSGMSVSADIITEEKDNVLTVPSEAIKSIGNKKYVEVLDKNTIQPSASNKLLFTSSEKPKRVFIETGISSDTKTEILSGLNEEDVVVVKTVSGDSQNLSPSNTQNTSNQNFRVFRIP